VPLARCPVLAVWASVGDVDREERERIDEREVRRSEDELATVGNCAGNCGAVVLVIVGLMSGLAWLLRRAR